MSLELPKAPRGNKRRIRNRYKLTKDLCIIYTSKNEEILIDKCNINKLPYNRTWFLHPSGYPVCKVNQNRVFLHHIILGRLPNKVVDHINGHKYDNRECNLRHCTHQENSYNSKTYKGKPLLGVSYCKKNGPNKWCARIQYNHTPILLGYFATKEEAIAVRRKAEIEYYREFARRQHNE